MNFYLLDKWAWFVWNSNYAKSMVIRYIYTSLHLLWNLNLFFGAACLRKSDSWVRSPIPVTTSATHNGPRFTTYTAVITLKLCLEQDSLPDPIPLYADSEYIVFFFLDWLPLQGKRVLLTRPFGSFLGGRGDI